MPKKLQKRGGGIFDSVLSALTPNLSASHPYLASASPNYIQTLSHSWNGSVDPVPRSSNAVDYSWQWKTSHAATQASLLGQINAMPPISYISTSRLPAATNSVGSPSTRGPSTGGSRRKTYRKRNRNRSRRRKSYRK